MLHEKQEMEQQQTTEDVLIYHNVCSHKLTDLLTTAELIAHNYTHYV